MSRRFYKKVIDDIANHSIPDNEQIKVLLQTLTILSKIYSPAPISSFTDEIF